MFGATTSPADYAFSSLLCNLFEWHLKSPNKLPGQWTNLWQCTTVNTSIYLTTKLYRNFNVFSHKKVYAFILRTTKKASTL